MDELVELLKEKNHFLKKFYLLNLKELKNFSDNKFENLEYFYDQREKLIEIISYIKTKIESLCDLPDLVSYKTNSLINSIEEKNNNIVKDIFSQDSEMLAHIENAKNTIIKELHKIKSGKQMVSKYKGFSKINNLDEEA